MISSLLFLFISTGCSPFLGKNNEQKLQSLVKKDLSSKNISSSDKRLTKQVKSAELDLTSFGREVDDGQDAFTARLKLNLFEDFSVIAILDKISRTEKITHWIGHAEGDPGSQIILSGVGKSLHGSIIAFGRSFEIRSSDSDNGVYIIRELDEEQLGETRKNNDEVILDEEEGTFDAASFVSKAANSTPVIDIMVAFSPEAKGNSSQDDLEAFAASWVTITNESYVNSEINASLRLVHVMTTKDSERGAVNNADRALQNLSNGNDGWADDVHAARTEFGADVVSMIVTDLTVPNLGRICGIAALLGTRSRGGNAFNLVGKSCGGLVFAHELGHNLGSAHDINNGGRAGGAFNYSVGHFSQKTGSAGFHTIMSYPQGRGRTHVPYYSNPSLSLAGETLGTTNRDNAKSHNNMVELVSRFKSSENPNTPGMDEDNGGEIPPPSVNSAPIANAGADKEVIIETTVSLNGSQSSDREGNSITFLWSQTSGSPVTFLDGSDKQPVARFVASAAGNLEFSLIVNDGKLSSSADTVRVKVNEKVPARPDSSIPPRGPRKFSLPPIARIYLNRTTSAGSEVTLDGSHSISFKDKPLTYTWKQTSGPQMLELKSSQTATPSFIVDAPGLYSFTLVVNDGNKDSRPTRAFLFVRKNP